MGFITLRLILILMVLALGGSLLAIAGAIGSLRSRKRSIRPAIILLALAILGLAGWTVTCWPVGDQPHSPMLVADPLALYTAMVAIAGTILAVLVAANQPAEDLAGEFVAMILFAAAGLVMVGMANNLLVMFLALELVSIPGFILVGLSRRHALAEEAAAKYFFLGVLATALTALGFVLLYGASGGMGLGAGGEPTLQAAVGTANLKHWLAMVGLIIAFAGLTFKITAIPFYFYAPDVYQGSAANVSAIIAFLPKMAGFIALLRIFAWVGFDGAIWQTFFPILWVVAAGTTTAGNVLALLQSDVKRILAYSSVAHSGYMLIGVAAVTGASAGLQNGLAAVLFYIFIYGLMTLGAFGVIGYLSNLRARSSARDELSDLGDLAGLWRVQPLMALILAVCVLSLLGIPPLAGFWAKVYIFTSALAGSRWLIVLAVVGLLNAAVAAGYYLRIIAAAYFSEPTKASALLPETPDRVARISKSGLMLVSAAVIVIGLAPAKLMHLCDLAARSLLPR